MCFCVHSICYWQQIGTGDLEMIKLNTSVIGQGLHHRGLGDARQPLFSAQADFESSRTSSSSVKPGMGLSCRLMQQLCTASTLAVVPLMLISIAVLARGATAARYKTPAGQDNQPIPCHSRPSCSFSGGIAYRNSPGHNSRERKLEQFRCFTQAQAQIEVTLSGWLHDEQAIRSMEWRLSII